MFVMEYERLKFCVLLLSPAFAHGLCFVEIPQGFSDPVYLLTSGHVIDHFGNVFHCISKGFH